MQLRLQIANSGTLIWQPTSKDAYTSHIGNPQTDHLLNVLGLPHIWTRHYATNDIKDQTKDYNNASVTDTNVIDFDDFGGKSSGIQAEVVSDKNEIDLDDVI